MHSGKNPHARAPPGIVDGSMGFYQTSSQHDTAVSTALPPGLSSPVQSTPRCQQGDTCYRMAPTSVTLCYGSGTGRDYRRPMSLPTPVRAIIWHR